MKTSKNFLSQPRFLVLLGFLFVLVSAALTFWALTATEVRGDDTDDVTVSATLQAFLQLSINQAELDLGNLVTSAGVSTPQEDSVIVTTSSNSDGGYHIQIESQNDGSLDHTTLADVIEGSGPTHTAEANADGYGGLCDASGSDLACESPFDTTSSPSVVKFTSAAQAFASSSSQTSDDEITLTIRASSLTTNPTGTYEDELTLTAITGLP